MIATPEGRWPPVYDADDLAACIDELVRAEDFDARFWDLRPIDSGEAFQGDVIALPSAVPLLDEQGQPVATDDCALWLVIGNTCDFARSIADVQCTQIVPIVDLASGVSPSDVRVFRQYRYSRRFYLPPWPQSDETHRFADFTRPVPLHKAAIATVAQVVARMQRPAWVLLHSCLIRFLARDDGRHEA